MSALNSNAKNMALKRFHNPYNCWTPLKSRYEADNNPRKAHVIDKFFGCKQLNTMSMEEYLVEMKEIVDSLEDANVALPEDIVVLIAVKNLPKEYDITKQMILNEKLPT